MSFAVNFVCVIVKSPCVRIYSLYIEISIIRDDDVFVLHCRSYEPSLDAVLKKRRWIVFALQNNPQPYFEGKCSGPEMPCMNFNYQTTAFNLTELTFFRCFTFVFVQNQKGL